MALNSGTSTYLEIDLLSGWGCRSINLSPSHLARTDSLKTHRLNLRTFSDRLRRHAGNLEHQFSAQQAVKVHVE